MTENRCHERVHSRLRCWCEGENVTVYARVGNMSEGGIFVRTSTPLAPGSRAVVRFGLGEALQFEARAQVVWSRGEGTDGPPGMGLKFEALDLAQQERIRQLIRGEQGLRTPGE